MEIIYTVVGIIYILCLTQSSKKEEFVLIVSGPQNVTKNEGDSASFSCTLNVEADFTKFNGFIWLKNSVVVPPNSTHYIRMVDDEARKCTLKIIKVERTDKGYYQCSVDGKKSEKAWLRVKEITGPPYPICEALKTEYKQHETVKAKCITENKWPKDDMDLYIKTENDNTENAENISYCHNDTHRWIEGKFKADAKPGNRIQIDCRIKNDIYESRRTCKNPVNLKIFSELPMNTANAGPKATSEPTKTTAPKLPERPTDPLTIIEKLFSDIESNLPKISKIYIFSASLLVSSVISNILLIVLICKLLCAA